MIKVHSVCKNLQHANRYIGSSTSNMQIEKCFCLIFSYLNNITSTALLIHFSAAICYVSFISALTCSQLNSRHLKLAICKELSLMACFLYQDFFLKYPQLF